MVVSSPAFVPTAPGIYPHLSYEQYDAIDAYRRSVITEGLRSMEHLKDAKDNTDSEETESLLFGTALHTAVLEPDRFERDVVLGPINPKTGEPFGRTTKACMEWAEENPDKIIMGKGDRDRLIGMGAKIRNHPRAMNLLRSCSQTELTMVWEDKVTGVRCKSRIDAFASAGMGFVDLKSCTDASAGPMSRALYDYGYHIQAAMVIDGWEATCKDTPGHWDPNEPFTLICVEKKRPYGIAVYTVGPESIAIARAQYREVLRLIVECQRTNIWPGYPTDVMTLDVPEWVFKRFLNAA